MRRVITYIDGFNLYFGLRSKQWKKYYWLDLHTLSQYLLKKDQQLLHCHYFTARIRATEADKQDARRQSVYLDALHTGDGITLHYGHFLKKRMRCQNCGSTWTSFEEKMTDVNIATQLLGDAYDDHFDTAILISADSDLTMPVKKIRHRFPEKRIIIALPPNRRSHELTKAANGHIIINETAYRHCQLPDIVTNKDGFAIQRPDYWQ